MNLNGKFESEEEQPLQYVNRFAINIPTGTAAFNLNIVNPGLSNQSYILNPVNSVGQNIVTQSPMALQSYIALPTEGEGNILHSLPVGVPVPVGFPVPTGLLQNHNFVNTSIIIGNEDCNSPAVIKPGTNNVNPGGEIISYIDKPVEQLTTNPNIMDTQSIGLTCPTQINTECLSKKPCPLEMSIKAANIEMEFDKSDLEVPILLDSCHSDVEKNPLLVGNFCLGKGLKEGGMKVPLEIPLVQTSNAVPQQDDKKGKTEITWEGNNVNSETTKTEFQESLICEVEESNEDDDEYSRDTEGNESNQSEEVKNGRTSNYESEVSASSSEESDSLPLSVALKRNRTNKRSADKRKQKGGHSADEKTFEEEKTRRKTQGDKKRQNDEESDGHWSESDDDALNLKRIKNEFNYKCFYEPNATKSATSLVLKLEDESKKFVRVRACCSKRECGKKISVQDQKAAHKHFHDLESTAKRDGYLVNCIEHVQKRKCSEKENAKEKAAPRSDALLESTDIQLEIENESNGNQKLSDEIQNAINESLKEFIGSESREEKKGSAGEEGPKPAVAEKGEKKNNWNFYLIVDRCRRKVCLQFLLKLFRIPKSRIKQLQKRILSGTTDDMARTNQKPEIWDVAKSHLDGLLGEECLDCDANPRHRFLNETRTREDLFVNFKEYYMNRLGKEPKIKYTSYKRFLDKETSISFTVRKEGTCAECEDLMKNPKRKQKKGSPKAKKNCGKEKEGKKKWVIKTDSEDYSSEEEPLLKRKKLKLTIPLKANKSQSGGKRHCKNNSVQKTPKGKTKEKAKQSGSRGRDVWSLMLLHLETMPYKECSGCLVKKKHRFLDSTFTTQGLFEDYRKYFLKETNSELGLGFTMYEKYFNKNCNYLIHDVAQGTYNCPACENETKKS